jgi:secondary thiamine-phosphate synthase enzyme
MFQEKVETRRREEMIPLTLQVAEALEKSRMRSGLCIIYVPHTTAGVTINENADPDVCKDILMGLGKIVPLNWQYSHGEGNSDAHLKASIVGSSVVVPVEDGKLLLGTWQGIYFCEFDGPRTRRVLYQFIPASPTQMVEE